MYNYLVLKKGTSSCSVKKNNSKMYLKDVRCGDVVCMSLT
jgi:hypothetical protein